VSEEFLCARCAKHQKTCCQHTDIFVTLGDVSRIASAIGTSDFTEYRSAASPAYDQTEEDPVWHRQVFRDDGTRRVLKQQPDGDCHFLGPQGCVLTATVRPLICRLYPFDYTSDGLKDAPAGGCPVELLMPGQQLLQVLAMNRDEAERYRAQLYAELQDEEDASVVSAGSVA